MLPSLIAAVLATTSPRPVVLSRVAIENDAFIEIEQEFHDAEEGSVLWDASRSLLAHVALQRARGESDHVSGQRLLEVGAGTGAVGLALARMGARSVVMTDKPSQLDLMRRNREHNHPDGCDEHSEHVAPVSILPLTWGDDWLHESAESLSKPDAFDTIICCDCVYPDRPSGLAGVLLDLLDLNPEAVTLLAFEQRPPPPDAPPGTDHTMTFFDTMRAGCDVERVPDSELDPQWMCDEISLWRMRARR